MILSLALQIALAMGFVTMPVVIVAAMKSGPDSPAIFPVCWVLILVRVLFFLLLPFSFVP